MRASTPVLVVKVEASDIAGGLPGQCASCPVALALKRALPDDATSINVMTYKASWHRGSSEFRVVLPEKARGFIQGFDATRGMAPHKPFTFEIEAASVDRIDWGWDE